MANKKTKGIFPLPAGKNIFGQEIPELTEEELLMMIMPGGGIGGAAKGAKGIMPFLKNMFGKAKSKAKFPVGYGYPVQKAHSQIDNLIAKDEILKLVKSVQKPKGIRQFGKFNRPLGKYGNKPE